MKKVREAFERWMDRGFTYTKEEIKFGYKISPNDATGHHRAIAFYAGWMAAKLDGK